MYYSFAHLYEEFDWGRKDKREDLLKHIPPKKGFKALDIGCGTGILSLQLKEMGYQVTGIDLSEKMIEIAKSKSNEIKWLVGDGKIYSFNDKYDLIVCPTNVINHFLNKKDLSELFKHIHCNLNAGGALYFDVPTKECLKDTPQTLSWVLGSDRLKVLSSFDDSRNIFFQITAYKDVLDQVTLRYWSQDELFDLLMPLQWDEIGFSQIRNGYIWRTKKS